jgi:hypothetical protein
MPRPKQNVLSGATAKRLIETLIDEGKIVLGDIGRYLHIAQLEDRLRALRGGEVPVRHRKAKATAAVTKKRSRRPVSAARRASMKLQGQYLGLLQRLPESQRAKYRSIAKEGGREKAIAAMKKAAGE